MSYHGIPLSELCGIPAGTPPKGQVSNLVDPPTLASVIWGLTISMTLWALAFTLTRIYVNFRKLKASDYFVIIAMVLDIVYSASIIAQVKWARHMWDIPVCWMTGDYMKTLFWEAMMYGPTIYFAKSSLLLLYLQLFSVKPYIRIATYIGLVAVAVCYWSNIPIEGPFLAPHSGEDWQDVVLNGRPERIEVWGLIQGPLNVVIDLYTFILPFPILAQLNLTRRRRIELGVVFSTAFLGVVVSIVALVYRVKLVYSDDTTWSQIICFLCIMLENNIAIVVSCMPAFAVFIKQDLSETTFYRFLRSALIPSGKGSLGSASYQGNWAGITFGGGNEKKARPKNRDEDTCLDSYIELNDASQSRAYSVGLQTQQQHEQWTTPDLAASKTPQPKPDYSMPEDGILRVTQVEQRFTPALAERGGQAL
ncbi:hypothetical protein VMCG_09954 [Cytospora schulzeri]|uniref:Rhodopsin domain-containing protein n=1 Tax=Cytospora schulzeri TaxID=448051 RepID=A0A423VF75_9PEZI|nr:hypothetical protein VMCG_09954 [Valsa malicola]